MYIDELIDFLIESNKVGYASGNSANTIKENDGSTSIFYQEGDWRFHDNYFGGEPYGGREIIFFRDKPCWIMVYYGQILSRTENTHSLYSFLQKALLLNPKEIPVRGPKKYTEDEFKYVNEWQGNIEKFHGEEKIFKKRKLVYNAFYVGGLVDQRKE